jgi:hypothetical protein
VADAHWSNQQQEDADAEETDDYYPVNTSADEAAL